MSSWEQFQKNTRAHKTCSLKIGRKIQKKSYTGVRGTRLEETEANIENALDENIDSHNSMKKKFKDFAKTYYITKTNVYLALRRLKTYKDRIDRLRRDFKCCGASVLLSERASELDMYGYKLQDWFQKKKIIMP
jgi:hypothetical protein